MGLSVGEYANARGISRQRALAMIRSGQIRAQKVGRAWVIDNRELGARQVFGRPLSARMAALVVAGLSGGSLGQLSPSDRFHVHRHLERLRASAEPAALLHSWMRSRQLHVVDVGANPADILEIAADKRAIPSGISDSRAGLSAAREFEGYIAEADLDAFLRDNLLVLTESPNVRLHVVNGPIAAPIPLGLVLADLADWNRPREDGRVFELIRDVEWSL